jgi:uncharacterized protein YwqG
MTETSQALSNAGLKRIIPDVQKLLQESIRLQATRSTENSREMGKSHLGGLPDLPPGFAWPQWKEIPMSFIAQIRLEDIDGFAPAKRLPKAGLLSFFYDATQNTYGSSPNDRGGWGVFYFNPEACASLHAATAPPGLPADSIFKECALRFSSENTLPTSAAQHLENFNWSEAEVKGYEDYLYNSVTDQERALPRHRMFGHPDQLQDDMQVQCALYANGVASLDEPRAAAFVKMKQDWLLLLQVDSDENAGMKWATYGMLYFWINAKALDAQKFDNTWLVLQAE